MEKKAVIFLRLPPDVIRRLHVVAAELTAKTPGATYTATQIARDAICARVEELEQGISADACGGTARKEAEKYEFQ